MSDVETLAKAADFVNKVNRQNPRFFTFARQAYSAIGIETHIDAKGLWKCYYVAAKQDE